MTEDPLPPTLGLRDEYEDISPAAESTEPVRNTNNFQTYNTVPMIHMDPNMDKNTKGNTYQVMDFLTWIQTPKDIPTTSWILTRYKYPRKYLPSHVRATSRT